MAGSSTRGEAQRIMILQAFCSAAPSEVMIRFTQHVKNPNLSPWPASVVARGPKSLNLQNESDADLNLATVDCVPFHRIGLKS